MLNKLQSSGIYIFVAALGVAAGSALDLATKVQDVFFRPDALVLAENNDRSRFSDSLIRLAWRRLFAADIYARRVADSAPWPLIDEAWRDYVSLLKDWNADLMINIVGLEKFYDRAKSETFETEIQNAFRAVDESVRSVYVSAYIRHRQRAPADDPSNLDRGRIQEVFDKTGEARFALYVFVRCFEKGRRDDRFSCKIN